MTINRYRIKDSVTRDTLLTLRFQEGGSWVIKDADLFICKEFELRKFGLWYSINIAFSKNISDWNDFDNVLIIDEEFGQPYTPFYGKNFGADITRFPCLQQLIENYNRYMDSFSIFEKVESRQAIEYRDTGDMV